jgi:class 3 adenylate cyclase
VVPWWKSFAFRFVALYTTAATILVLFGVGWLYQREKEEVVGKFGLALESIAATTAPFIAGADLDRVRVNEDATNDAFRRVAAILKQTQKQNGFAADQVYVVRPRGRSYEFVVMLQERTFVGDLYHPPAVLETLYQWVFENKDTARSPLYYDENGAFISGVAPVLRYDGTVAGMLQVDYGIDTYLSEIDQVRMVYLAGLGLMIALFVAFGFWMQRRLRRDVIALVGGTTAIALEDYDHVVVVRSEDEMAAVANALNQALRGLKERFEMLKFIPRHTATMISETEGDVDLSIARRVEIAVFHSDIRGFTSLSGTIPPEEVVAMLNDYIRVQAELIEAAGGSIDKYMGDAVLAIFEGEHKERRAVECAIAVQDAVAQMNAAGAFRAEVLVGIGITAGEVVMGNMGSDQRMEYTVIGSPVNLSARLCSQAQGAEIVVSREVRAALDDSVGLRFAQEEKIKVKGFEEAIACYRATAQPMTAEA